MSSYFSPYTSHCRLFILCYRRLSVVTHSISAVVSLHACYNIPYNTPSQKFVTCYNISYVSNIFLKGRTFCYCSHCFVSDPASMFHQIKRYFFFCNFKCFSLDTALSKWRYIILPIGPTLLFCIPVTQKYHNISNSLLRKSPFLLNGIYRG